MIQAFIKGFLVHVPLIIAIGIQSAYLIRCGLRRERVFLLATLFSIYDIFFMGVGAMGMGTIIAQDPFFKKLAALGSILFFLCYATKSFYNSWFKSMTLDDTDDIGPTNDLSKVLKTSLIVTFLNPQSYVDTFLVIAGYAAQFDFYNRIAFGFGLWTVSIIWFYGLGYGAALLSPYTKNPKVWKGLDAAMGVVFLYLAINIFFYVL